MPDPSVCAQLLTLLLQLDPLCATSTLLTSGLSFPPYNKLSSKSSLLRCRLIPALHTQCLHEKVEVGDKH